MRTPSMIRNISILCIVLIALQIVTPIIPAAAEDIAAPIAAPRLLFSQAPGLAVLSDIPPINPVSGDKSIQNWVSLDSMDNDAEWYSANAKGLDIGDFKQGSASLYSSGSGIDRFFKAFSSPLDTGTTYEYGNLSFWLYVSDPSKITESQIEIGSSGKPDMNEYSWPIPGNLTAGWNLVDLPLKLAGVIGAPNLKAINWFRLYCVSTGDITLKIDSLMMYEEAHVVLPAPDPEPPLSTKYTALPPPGTAYGQILPSRLGATGGLLDACDALSAWATPNILSNDSYDKQEGKAALASKGKEVVRFSKAFSAPVDAKVLRTDGSLEFWLYVSDITKLSADGQIEIGSSGKPDVNEYNWPMPTALKNGWNLVILNLNRAGRTGTPNLKAINWFRMYFSAKGDVTLKIDDIRFTKIDPTKTKPTPLYNPPIVRKASLVTPVYPTEDAVVADFIVTDAPYYGDKTGVKDSTDAINKALDDCYKAGGGTVWMPAGNYRITGTLQIKPFCTLRGDWRDPDAIATGTTSINYGTVIIADVPSNTLATPGLIRIGGSAGAMGLTVYYPRQSATNPVPYPYTFEIPGGAAWNGQEDYMMSSVINCTMINSYRGICTSITPDQQGRLAYATHECVTVQNVKGTVLYCGTEAYNGADVGTWENVKFSNRYWAAAGTAYKAPARATLDAWTRKNGVGFKFGDLEWDQFIGLEASDYRVGIKIVKGIRTQFCGEFLYSSITNCDTAVSIHDLGERTGDNFGVSFARCTLSGSSYGVLNYTYGYVQLTDCTLSGQSLGRHIVIKNPGTSPTAYPTRKLNAKPTKSQLLDVTQSPFSADKTAKTDATAAIQKALNAASASGGGVVYLPAGRYKVNTHLAVPANVELRGSSSVPTRDQLGSSKGTVIFGYEGRGTTDPDTATALVTLNGSNAGVRGIRFFYPENNPGGTDKTKPYPYTIRGNGSSVYAVNIGLAGVYNGIDFKTFCCDNHFVRKVVGCAYNKFIVVGPSTEGWVEGCLSNPTAVVRVGYGIPSWVSPEYGGALIIDLTLKYEELVVVNGASNEHILNNFAYGTHIGFHVVNGTAIIFNGGTDNLGEDGIGVLADSTPVTVVNYMRYNGNASQGDVTFYNRMAIE